MAQFKDILASETGWIHELARAEIHPDAERLLELGRSFDPQQLIEESTVDFLAQLRERFTEFARIFNGYSESGEKFQEIKVYAIAQSAADFMVFRNQVKLIVTNSAHGVIQLSFTRHARGAVAVDGQAKSAEGGEDGPADLGKTQEILAQVGPFRDIDWTFQGEKVSAEKVARFYFAEFVRTTRAAKRSRAANQVLLDQIKSLLEEKGLDF